MAADVEFRNTGLERSKRLAKDLEWFESQGHTIPEAGPAGTSYADYLTELSETNVPAFICHFYNVYFAHSAGGRFIGKKVCKYTHLWFIWARWTSCWQPLVISHMIITKSAVFIEFLLLLASTSYGLYQGFQMCLIFDMAYT